jgi:hypothetical protein
MQTTASPRNGLGSEDSLILKFNEQIKGLKLEDYMNSVNSQRSYPPPIGEASV